MAVVGLVGAALGLGACSSSGQQETAAEATTTSASGSVPSTEPAAPVESSAASTDTETSPTVSPGPSVASATVTVTTWDGYSAAIKLTFAAPREVKSPAQAVGPCSFSNSPGDPWQSGNDVFEAVTVTANVRDTTAKAGFTMPNILGLAYDGSKYISCGANGTTLEVGQMAVFDLAAMGKASPNDPNPVKHAMDELRLSISGSPGGQTCKVTKTTANVEVDGCRFRVSLT